jgi:hypothetical protein
MGTSHMIKKIFGLLDFILTGLGMVGSVIINSESIVNAIILLIFCCFYAIGIKEYIKNMDIR